jgi:excisionase family DNA binding protein
MNLTGPERILKRYCANPPRMTEKFVSTREAAERLGISPSAVQTMIRHGEIKALRKGRLVRISESDLQDLVDQKDGRMTGDMDMSEIRALEEFKRHLSRALEDEGVKQSLQECISGAPFREQLLEALDLPEVKEKLAKIGKR